MRPVLRGLRLGRDIETSRTRLLHDWGTRDTLTAKPKSGGWTAEHQSPLTKQNKDPTDLNLGAVELEWSDTSRRAPHPPFLDVVAS